MKAAAALLAIVLFLPASAGAVMPEQPAGGVSGDPPPRVLTLEELRALSRERAGETVQSGTSIAPAAVPPAAVPVRAPSPAPIGPGAVLLLAGLTLAAAGVVAAVLKIRLRRRGAAAGAKPPVAEPDGSTVESLWRMHLRRRR